MHKVSLLFILVISMAIIGGCTMPVTTPAAPAPASPAAAPAVTQAAAPASNGMVRDVDMIQKAFDPDIITISAGTTVVWTNKDTVSHRVVHLPELPNDRELFHSEPVYRGQTFRYTFQTPGRYYYSDPQYAGGRKSLVIVT
jgi:plastocyanin